MWKQQRKQSTPKRRKPSPLHEETFEDIVSLQDVPMSQGIMLNTKMYAKNTVRQLAAHGDRRVPHSRRRITDEELMAAMDTPMDRLGAIQIRTLITMGVVAAAQSTLVKATTRVREIINRGAGGFGDLDIGTEVEGPGVIVYGDDYAMRIDEFKGRPYAALPLGPVAVHMRCRASGAVMVVITDNKTTGGPGWTRYAGLNGVVAEGINDAMRFMPSGMGIESIDDRSVWGGA